MLELSKPAPHPSMTWHLALRRMRACRGSTEEGRSLQRARQASSPAPEAQRATRALRQVLPPAGPRADSGVPEHAGA